MRTRAVVFTAVLGLDHWFQVFPYVLSCLDDGTWIAERLLEINSDDDELRRPLFMIALGLGDGAIVSENVKREVVDELENLARGREFMVLESVADASKALSALSRMQSDRYAQQSVSKLCEEWLTIARGNGAQARKTLEAAIALDDLGLKDIAMAILESLAHNSKVLWNVRWEAINNISGSRLDTLLDDIDMDDPIAASFYDDYSGIDIEDAVEQRELADRISDVISEADYERAMNLENQGHMATELDLLWRLFYDDNLSCLEDVAKGRYEYQDCLSAARSLGMNGFEQEAASVLLALYGAQWRNTSEYKEIVRSFTTWAPNHIHKLIGLICDPSLDASRRELIASSLQEIGYDSHFIYESFLQGEMDNSHMLDDRLDAIGCLLDLGYVDEVVWELLAIVSDGAVSNEYRLKAAEVLSQADRRSISPAIEIAIQNIIDDGGQPEVVKRTLKRIIRAEGSFDE